VPLGLLAANTLLRLPDMPHYAIAAYPAVTVLAALALERWAALRPWRALGVAAIVTSAHLFLWSACLEFMVQETRPLVGRYAPFYILAREVVDRELAKSIARARGGGARIARELARDEARFAASDDVRLRWDAARGEPALDPLDCVALELTGAGVEIRPRAAPFWFELPHFEIEAGEHALARLELTVPLDTMWLVFCVDPASGGVSRRGAIEAWVDRGRQVVFLELDGDVASGALRLRVPVHRATLQALEIRRVEPR